MSATRVKVPFFSPFSTRQRARSNASCPWRRGRAALHDSGVAGQRRAAGGAGQRRALAGAAWRRWGAPCLEPRLRDGVGELELESAACDPAEHLGLPRVLEEAVLVLLAPQRPHELRALDAACAVLRACLLPKGNGACHKSALLHRAGRSEPATAFLSGALRGRGVHQPLWSGSVAVSLFGFLQHCKPAPNIGVSGQSSITDRCKVDAAAISPLSQRYGPGCERLAWRRAARHQSHRKLGL